MRINNNYYLGEIKNYYGKLNPTIKIPPEFCVPNFSSSGTYSLKVVNGKTGNITLTCEDVGATPANTEIIRGTKCKITYDSKGLVTTGEDLTSANIPDISETYETKFNKSDSFTES